MQEQTISHDSPQGRSRLEFLENGVAVLHLGSAQERVVTLTVDRMNSIREALERVRQQKPPGLVIVGPSRDMFTAGADITMIKEVTDPAIGESLARQGQELYSELEGLPFPTVAAISGPCVGGGCEMVLACTYRIITDEKSSSIGLPETKLGILPGFGGTQRMPRLIGLPKALDIILAGKVLKPRQAIQCGLVDEIVRFEGLLDRASQILVSEKKPTRKKISLFERLATSNSLLRSYVAKKAGQSIAKLTKGFYPAPPAALNAVIYGLKHGTAAGYQHEARELGRLIVTPESKSLVNVFFLSEAAKGLGKPARKAVESIHGLVIGAGVMGAGIAGTLVRNEGSVIIKDTSDDALKRSVEQIKKYLGGIKYLTEAERSFMLNRVETTTRESSNIGSVNVVIEAVFEDISLKSTILSNVAKLVPAECIIATNTSSLSVTKIADVISHPERVAGMHFFNPVEKMPLVEIIRGEKTNDNTIVMLAALAVKLGKYPIVVRDVPGFLVNRILTPYLNEAAFLLAEGYSIQAIDKAATRFGMPMGPLRLLDEVGLDVASHVAEIMVAGYGERMAGPGYARALLDRGRKGRKSNGGFYDFNGDKAVAVDGIRDLLGITAAPKDEPRPGYLADRLVMQLINEAVKCLDEGVAGAPGKDAANQIDLGTVMGMGFPPFRGGLLHYAHSLGVPRINELLLAFEQELGPRYTRAVGIAARESEKIDLYHACPVQ